VSRTCVTNLCQVKSGDSYFQAAGREIGGGGEAGGEKEGGDVGGSNRLKVATQKMDSQSFLKVFSIVSLYSRCIRALTLENLCQLATQNMDSHGWELDLQTFIEMLRGVFTDAGVAKYAGGGGEEGGGEQERRFRRFAEECFAQILDIQRRTTEGAEGSGGGERGKGGDVTRVRAVEFKEMVEQVCGSLKVVSMLTLHGKCFGALNFENLRQAIRRHEQRRI
jgi:hypothetical protein